MTCRIYVACLASYNRGRLHGRWIDVDPDDDGAEELGEAIQAMLKESPVPGAEEYAIHDYDGPLGRLACHFGEHPDLADLVRLVSFIEDTPENHGAYIVEVFRALDYDLDRLEACMDEGGPEGPYDGPKEYAMACAEAAGYEEPDWCKGAIDYERLGVDWLSGRSILLIPYTAGADIAGLYVLPEV